MGAWSACDRKASTASRTGVKSKLVLNLSTCFSTSLAAAGPLACMARNNSSSLSLIAANTSDGSIRGLLSLTACSTSATAAPATAPSAPPTSVGTGVGTGGGVEQSSRAARRASERSLNGVLSPSWMDLWISAGSTTDGRLSRTSRIATSTSAFISESSPIRQRCLSAASSASAVRAAVVAASAAAAAEALGASSRSRLTSCSTASDISAKEFLFSRIA
mmetsp:Transcript_120517/g.300635  ORF Transcript_120517/g.300635 Transcript_120517/m.300635 type:complete len:219 (+) Transcript_120517:356-1012(+)